MVSPSRRGIRAPREIVDLLLLERVTKTLDLSGKPHTHQLAKVVIVVFRIMFAVGTVVLRQFHWRDVQRRADDAKIIGEILKTHDVINVTEWIVFALV